MHSICSPACLFAVFVRRVQSPASPVPVWEDLNKKNEVGNFLLSQEAALQVPSADTRLTAGFGMFPGIPTLLWSPTSLLIYLFVDRDCPFIGLPQFLFPNFLSGHSHKGTVPTLFLQYVVVSSLLKTYLFLTPRKSLRSLVPVCSSHY